MCSMSPSLKAMHEKKLLSMGAAIKRGLVVIQGRIPKDDLANLLGKRELPVLMPSTRLAYLILFACHCEDHRLGPADAVARSRSYAWIVRAGQLAKYAIKSCMHCRLQSKKAVQQIMGELPMGRLEMCPAFTCMSLDMFGPYLTRGMGPGSRKSFKVWGLLYT